jgi:hypothetical protein
MSPVPETVVAAGHGKDAERIAAHFAEPSDDIHSRQKAPPAEQVKKVSQSGGDERAGTKMVNKSSSMERFVRTHVWSRLSWSIPIITDWSRMKPVFRSALAAWLCMLCMVISPIEVALGSASFLVLVGIFIAPCEQPLAVIVEREFFTLLLTTAGWAYSNLAIFFAHLARRHKVSAADTVQSSVYSGAYIEAGPTAICTLFLAFGVGCLLYLKVKFGPSPFLFASILGCIALDIT